MDFMWNSAEAFVMIVEWKFRGTLRCFQSSVGTTGEGGRKTFVAKQQANERGLGCSKASWQPRGRACRLPTNRRIKEGEFEPRVIAPVIANAPGKKENG
jgi:hypothetical protein